MSTTTKAAIQTANLYSLDKVRELTSTPQTRDKIDGAETTRVSKAVAATQSTMQIEQLARLAYSRGAPSNDARYVKFVEAVRALRVDLDLSTLSRAQIDRIIASAERLYMINDGVPEPVEPEPIDPTEKTETKADSEARDDPSERTAELHRDDPVRAETSVQAQPADPPEVKPRAEEAENQRSGSEETRSVDDPAPADRE